jgi:hypothetical protein
MYNQLIEENHLYTLFLLSDEWEKGLEAIAVISPELSDAIGQYGIGTKLDDSGRYDFESGQLLEDLPKRIKDKEAKDEAYDAVCDLAHGYADFVCAWVAKHQ